MVTIRGKSAFAVITIAVAVFCSALGNDSITSTEAAAKELSAEENSAKVETFEPGIELPAGKGRALILKSCTRCHDLRGVPAYKGYWNREQWLAMVETMVQHGAQLNPQQAALAADYLDTHFGRDAKK